jgi:hypothetical protein
MARNVIRKLQTRTAALRCGLSVSFGHTWQGNRRTPAVSVIGTSRTDGGFQDRADPAHYARQHDGSDRHAKPCPARDLQIIVIRRFSLRKAAIAFGYPRER